MSKGFERPLADVLNHPNRYTGQPPISGGDDGGSMLEARVARLESDVEYIKRDVAEIKGDLKDMRKEVHSDFKWLLLLGIGAVAALAGLMAKGFHWIGT